MTGSASKTRNPMSNEEIKVTMGLDVGPLALGLRKADGLLDEFEHSKAGKLWEELFPLASIGGAIATLEKAIGKARDLTRMADEFGISTSFAQDITNVGLLSGISAEKIEKMMGAFEKSLPVGSDVEDEFYRIADLISGIEDPVTRAHMAFDAFGKAGYKLLPILEKGSAGIKELGDSFSKFSNQDIADLEKTELALKQFESFFTVWTGRIVSTGQSFWGAMSKGFEEVLTTMMTGGSESGANGGRGIFGDFWHGITSQLDEELADKQKRADEAQSQKEAEAIAKSDAESKRIEDAHAVIRKAAREKELHDATPQKQLELLEDRKMYLGLAITDEESYLELEGEILKVEEKIHDVKKKIAEEDKKKADKLKHDEDRLNAASDKWIHARDALAKTQRPEFTLEDLAQRGRQWYQPFANRGGTWVQSQGSMQANEIERLRGWAKENAIQGNDDLAKEQWSKADKLFDDLKKRFPFLKDPQEELKEHAKKSRENLDEILGLAKGPGVNTNPANAP